MPTLGDRIATVNDELFVGRRSELGRFRQWLVGEWPHYTLLGLTGPGGVGKTTLLQACSQVASEEGYDVVSVDGRTIEATPEGFVHALGGADPHDAAQRLNARDVVLIIDTFEELAPIARFLRDEFLPSLDARVKVVLSGRRALADTAMRAWPGLIHSISLEQLAPTDCHEYLLRRGIQDAERRREIIDHTRGHPLALSLAADLAARYPGQRFGAVKEWGLVLRSLVALLLSDVANARLRAALEAACVVRQFDEAALTAISGREFAERDFTELLRLSFVRGGERGYMLHDDVRAILADDFRMRNPERYAEYRRRASAFYRERLKHAPEHEKRSVMVEILYLLEDTAIQREYYLGRESLDVWVDRYEPEDRADLLAIHALYREHLAPGPAAPPPEEADPRFAAAVLDHPRADIAIARDGSGRALGYGFLLPIDDETRTIIPPGGIARLIDEAVPSEEGAPRQTPAWYLSSIVLTGEDPEIVWGALGRFCMGYLARPAIFLALTGNPIYKATLEAGGFERVFSTRPPGWAHDDDLEGYVLDTVDIGVDAWIGAIMAGLRPVRPPRGDRLEAALQDALAAWRDDERLSHSPLVTVAGATFPDTPPAEAVRKLIIAGIERATAKAPPRDRAAVEALRAGYVEKVGSLESAANAVSVSRATFFRLLKRGIAVVARHLYA